ncbi:MAG: NlpC/P60 family protein [Patescibacteria group bacterium]
MDYRAVGNRCAVAMDPLQLPIPTDQAVDILETLGFRVVAVDLIALARQCVGTSRYRRGARLSQAPAVVDCSSLTKWLYAQLGIWLPRRSIQQRDLGFDVWPHELLPGDLVFVSGWINYYHHDPASGVGHVGIATGAGTVIHAANRQLGVVESPLDAFVGQTKWRCAKRYLPVSIGVLTLETPAGREVETSSDILWIIRQSLPRTKQQ